MGAVVYSLHLFKDMLGVSRRPLVASVLLLLTVFHQACSDSSKNKDDREIHTPTLVADGTQNDETHNVEAGPWTLFRVGVGGYATNGKSFCVFQSESHLNNCGYATRDYVESPLKDSTPSSQENLGICSCNLDQPFVFKLATNNSKCSGKPIAPIFILAGQSNAEGVGKLSDISANEWFFDFWNKRGFDFKFGKGPTFTGWSLGNEVLSGVWYLSERIVGPELGLSALIQADGWKKFYFFKSAVGGTSLATDWRARGQQGLYDKTVDALKKAADEICESGFQPDVRAFFWMQGESDANDGNHGVSYRENLLRLIDQAREDFLSPGAPVILGKIQINPDILDAQGNSNVRAAQDEVSRLRSKVAVVETSDLERYSLSCSSGSPFCNVHYTALGSLRLAERFYAAFERLNGMAPISSLAQYDVGKVAPVYRLVSPVEHFWSASPTGEGAAKYGYQWEGQTFHVFKESNTQADRPIFRLVGARHVFTASTEERNYLLANGYQSEGILGSIASRPRDDLRPLHLWRLNSFNRSPNFFSIYFSDNDPLAALGYKYQGVVGYVPTQGIRPDVPYKVGAYYFGMFGPQSLETPGHIFSLGASAFYQNTLSPQDWWAGIRDLFEKKSFSTPQASLFESYRQADWSHLKPAIGYYDQSKVATLEKHIRQASQNGLSYFSFYWYWDFEKADEILSDGINSFLSARNSNELEFMLSVCVHGYRASMSPSQQDRAAQLLVTKYLSRSNYLRIGGRSVIQMCAADGFLARDNSKDSSGNFAEDLFVYLNPQSSENISNRADRLRSFIEKVNAAALSAGLALPIWTIRSDDGVLSSLMSRADLKSLMSAGQCILSFSDISNYRVSAPLTAQRNNVLGASLGKAIMPCVSQNFDERPRMGVMKELVPSGLFRIGQNAYLINELFPGGPAYCSFSSQAHLNSCGFSNEEFEGFPQRTSLPNASYGGVCACNASNPWHTPVRFQFMTEYSDQSFATALRNIKDWMDARVDTADPLAQHLTIYAWNEWHEGGIIEPNSRDGARLLNLINDIFQLKQGADPCRLTGRCFESH